MMSLIHSLQSAVLYELADSLCGISSCRFPTMADRKHGRIFCRLPTPIFKGFFLEGEAVIFDSMTRIASAVRELFGGENLLHGSCHLLNPERAGFLRGTRQGKSSIRGDVDVIAVNRMTIMPYSP
jgi:hypothetical protein